MKLSSAARRFDRLVFSDAYTSTPLFKGQFDAAAVPTRDSLTDVRQVLSVAPIVSIPSRRVIKTADGVQWIVGGETRDYFNASTIRSEYVVHQADGLASLKTFDQTLQGQAGYALYAARIWVKSEKEVEIDSGLMNVFNIYTASNESVQEGSLVSLGGRWHLVRTTYPSAAGFQVVVADELPEPVVVTANVSVRQYIPINDTYAETVVSVSAVRIRWQAHFKYLSEASKKFKPGDTVLVVRKASVTLKAGDAVTVAGGSYCIEAVLDEGAVWAAHLRHG